MPVDSFEDYADDNVEFSANEIDPRDTYGSRFSVTSRRVSTSNKPRSAITTGQRHLRNSDKIFTKHHDRDNLGGSVNIKNINRAKPKKLVNIEDVSVTQKIEKPKKVNKSSGLDSLFESTVKSEEKTETINPVSEVFASPEDTNKIKMTQSERDATFEKFQANVSNRALKVIKPISYNSAKEIASALKSESAVVLVLKNINEDTAKRLLDFSFGAASMCGAKVSLEAKKTYVITIGPGLTQREKLLCIKEGVALKVDK